LLALWLAALWLPMTMHCQLAGLKLCCTFGACCEEGACDEDQAICNNPCCGGGATDCLSGVCKLVETGNYFLKRLPLAVPLASADWMDVPELLDWRRMLPSVAVLSEATGAPPGWNRVWQFACRAALAPRAPSAVC